MGLRGFQSSVMLNKRFSYLKGGYCKKIVLLDIIYGGNIVETGRSFVDCFLQLLGVETCPDPLSTAGDSTSSENHS